MLIVVLLFMIATVAVPTVPSILKAGASALPSDLTRVTGDGLRNLAARHPRAAVRQPDADLRARAQPAGALERRVARGAGRDDRDRRGRLRFPADLTSISTIARFGTTIVFILIMLGWYVVALVILSGAIVNAMRLAWTPPGLNDELELAMRS